MRSPLVPTAALSLVPLLLMAVASLIPLGAHAQGEAVTLVQPERTAPALQIFGWVDLRGAWHFVDSLSLVPPEHRRQASANAMSVGVLATASTRPAAPAISTREVRREPAAKSDAERRPTLSGQDAERRARVEELRRDRTRLQSEIAALEEGSAPASYLDRAKGGAIDDQQISDWLVETEDQLIEVDAELGRLSGATER